jgi:hypothetical protein
MVTAMAFLLFEASGLFRFVDQKATPGSGDVNGSPCMRCIRLVMPGLTRASIRLQEPWSKAMDWLGEPGNGERLKGGAR